MKRSCSSPSARESHERSRLYGAMAGAKKTRDLCSAFPFAPQLSCDSPLREHRIYRCSAGAICDKMTCCPRRVRLGHCCLVHLVQLFMQGIAGYKSSALLFMSTSAASPLLQRMQQISNYLRSEPKLP